jgi:hypothetical protein
MSEHRTHQRHEFEDTAGHAVCDTEDFKNKVMEVVDEVDDAGPIYGFEVHDEITIGFTSFGFDGEASVSASQFSFAVEEMSTEVSCPEASEDMVVWVTLEV